MENQARSKEEVAREVELTRAEAKRALKNAGEVWTGRNSIAAAWRSTKGKYYRAQDKVLDAAYVTNKTVRQNVYTTLGIAIGVGALIGYLTANKSRRSRRREC